MITLLSTAAEAANILTLIEDNPQAAITMIAVTPFAAVLSIPVTKYTLKYGLKIILFLIGLGFLATRQR